MRYRIPNAIVHHDDVNRIVRIFESRGHDISPVAAQWAWNTYSKSDRYSWMVMDDLFTDGEIFEICCTFLASSQ